ncbi:hypothetical membrane protein [Rhodococcus opacus B4]|uniref:Hypothetical membrane protein n=1 Tax=Rhodococcus opacus (strain B4) TaxID=632772 RepID=C1B852_RHOOB|nr:hypothetical membrane protein [Rhodococcus opacus B4]
MAWLLFLALGVVALVARVVLPRRARLERAPGFPWFWVAFPVTCLAVAAAVGAFTAWPHAVSGMRSFWWDLTTPDNAHGMQFLSSEQYHRFVTMGRARQVLPVVAVAGIVWCVWTWRRGRV